MVFNTQEIQHMVSEIKLRKDLPFHLNQPKLKTNWGWDKINMIEIKIDIHNLWNLLSDQKSWKENIDKELI